jgi:hypothetical protein
LERKQLTEEEINRQAKPGETRQRRLWLPVWRGLR